MKDSLGDSKSRPKRYIPGELMLLGGVLFSGGWIAFAMVTFFLDRAKHGTQPSRVAMG